MRFCLQLTYAASICTPKAFDWMGSWLMSWSLFMLTFLRRDAPYGRKRFGFLPGLRHSSKIKMSSVRRRVTWPTLDSNLKQVSFCFFINVRVLWTIRSHLSVVKNGSIILKEKFVWKRLTCARYLVVGTMRSAWWINWLRREASYGKSRPRSFSHDWNVTSCRSNSSRRTNRNSQYRNETTIEDVRRPSFRLWHRVTLAIRRNDRISATTEKTLIEDKQRKLVAANSSSSRSLNFSQWWSSSFCLPLYCEKEWKRTKEQPRRRPTFLSRFLFDNFFRLHFFMATISNQMQVCSFASRIHSRTIGSALDVHINRNEIYSLVSKWSRFLTRE